MNKIRRSYTSLAKFANIKNIYSYSVYACLDFLSHNDCRELSIEEYVEIYNNLSFIKDHELNFIGMHIAEFL